MKFRRDDAAIVINAIDKVSQPRSSTSATATQSIRLSIPSTPKVLKEKTVPHRTRSHAFKLLRQLAGASRQVPKSYLIGKSTRFKVKDEIHANGGFADIREGRLGKRVVAVKTLRKSRETKIDVLHEVCEAAGCSAFVN